MAKKIRTASGAEGGIEQTVEELDVLHPERIVQAGGKRVTVREYGGVEWLRMLPDVTPIIARLAGLIEGDQAPPYDAVLAALASSTDSLLPLVAQACDEPSGFVAGLDPEDLEMLLLTWWGVNGRFFIASATIRATVAMAQRRLARSAGASSTLPSSPTATGSATSAATPADS